MTKTMSMRICIGGAGLLAMAVTVTQLALPSMHRFATDQEARTQEREERIEQWRAGCRKLGVELQAAPDLLTLEKVKEKMRSQVCDGVALR